MHQQAGGNGGEAVPNISGMLKGLAFPGTWALRGAARRDSPRTIKL